MFFPSNAARVVVQFEETFPSSYGTAEAVPFQNEFKLSHYPVLRRVSTADISVRFLPTSPTRLC
jgi:hypothetical protein